MSSTWGIIGHDWAVDLLQQELASGRIGHAYLITGAAHVGRSTLAVALAQALNCTQESVNARPCGRCRSCRLIAGGRHPDLLIIEPVVSGRGTRSIKIDQIRALQHTLNLAAIEGRYKIALIREFDTTTIGAANAFLKTLEEPPPNVIIILTASDADALLQTITSRCQTLNLRPVAAPLVENELESRYEMRPPDTQKVAQLANGRLGWAFLAAEEPTLIESHEAAIDSLHDLLGGSRVERFAAADQLARNPQALTTLLDSWASWWRDAVIVTVYGETADDMVINRSEIDPLVVLNSHVEKTKILDALNATLAAQEQLSQNGNIRLVLEVLLLNYPLIENLRVSADPG